MIKKKKQIFYSFALLLLFALAILDLVSVKNHFTSEHYIRKQLRKQLGDSFSFQSSSFNILRGVSIHKFALSAEIDGKRSELLSIDRVQIDYNPIGLVTQDPIIKDIILHGPEGQIFRTEEGQWNFDAFLRSMPEREQPAGGEVELPFSIVVRNGTLNYRDSEVFAEGNSVQVQNLNLEIHPLLNTGKISFVGEGTEASMGTITLQGRLLGNTLSLNVNCRHVELTSDLVSQFNRKVQEVWNRYRPSGVLGLHYNLNYQLPTSEPSETRDIGSIQPGASDEVQQYLLIDLIDVQGRYEEFPYPVEHIQGEIKLQPDRISLQGLEAYWGGKYMTLSGSIGGYSEHPPLDIKINAEGFPVDEDLLNALDPGPREFVRKLNMSGWLDGSAQITQKAGDEEPVYKVRIHPRFARVKYEEFPYPFRSLQGTVLVDPSGITIQEIYGIPDLPDPVPTGSHTTVTGHIRPPKKEKGGEKKGETSFDLLIQAQQLPLTETLKKNLPEDVKKIWERMNISGTGNAIWHVSQSDVSSTPNHKIEISLRNCQIKPEEFTDMPIKNVSANIDYQNDRITLSDASGNWNGGTLQVKDAEIGTGNSGLQKTILKISGDQIPVNSEVKKLIFGEGEFVKSLQDQGTFDVDGKVIFDPGERGKGDEKSDFYISSTLSEVEFKNDLRISEVQGQLFVHGRWRTNGDETLKTYTGGANLSRIRIDKYPLQSIDANFQFANDTLKILDINGRSFNGTISDGKLIFGVKDGSFETSFSLSGLHLKEILRQTRMSGRNIRGLIDGNLSLKGDSAKKSTWEGNGKLELRNSQLWHLPLFYTVFLKLSLQKQEPFERGEVKFDVKDKKIKIKHMKFESENSRLFAKGDIGFNGDLDLGIKTEVDSTLFPSLPLIEWVLSFFWKNLWTLRAGGTFSDPSVTITPLPALFD